MQKIRVRLHAWAFSSSPQKHSKLIEHPEEEDAKGAGRGNMSTTTDPKMQRAEKKNVHLNLYKEVNWGKNFVKAKPALRRNICSMLDYTDYQNQDHKDFT